MSVSRFRAPKTARPTIKVKGGYDFCGGRNNIDEICSNQACINGQLAASRDLCPRCHGSGVELSIPRRSRHGLQMRKRSIQTAVRRDLKIKKLTAEGV